MLFYKQDSEVIMYISMLRVGAPEGEFQISMDCTYRPNDVVPIVGKTLLHNCRCFDWSVLDVGEN